MSRKITVRQGLPILGEAIATLFRNPQLLYPFFLLGFIQFLLMEVLFFANRFPLAVIFAPVITRLHGPQYLHYPFNYELLNHWFQSARVVVYFFFTSFFVGKVVLMVARINNNESAEGKMPRLGLRRYVNLIAIFFLTFLLVHGLTSAYGLLIRRATAIRSTDGLFFIIKQSVLLGAPYFSLFFSIIVTVLFAYVIPLVVLDRKNVIIAFLKNFWFLGKTLLPLFIIILLSSLLYAPVLLLRSNQQWMAGFLTPEVWQIFTIAGVIIMLLIDAVQYTAITMCFLLTKDDEQ